MITTEAWILYKGSDPRRSALDTAEFKRESYSFPDIGAHDLLVEPLFGCWEGNMSHAIARSPIDVCRQRKEDRVVLGNSGVVRILRLGSAVTGLCEGDVGALFGGGTVDDSGYMIQALGYDLRDSMGVLAKQARVAAMNFLPIPPDSRYSYRQWAAFSLRYLTAWSNWKVAYGAYRLQMSEIERPTPHVWGWGGGVTFAELDLARRQGCRVAMISGSDAHLEAIEAAGIAAIDRRRFPDLALDDERYAADPAYRKAYQESENALLSLVKERTGGMGVEIFLDYVGGPYARATLKSLARQGVISTAGWLLGMAIPVNRAMECLKRHTHVHTHYARRAEGLAAIQYAVTTGWMPEVTEVYGWSDVSQLAEAAAAGTVHTYFPVYEVNPV